MREHCNHWHNNHAQEHQKSTEFHRFTSSDLSNDGKVWQQDLWKRTIPRETCENNGKLEGQSRLEDLFLKALTSCFTGFLTGQGSAPAFSLNALEILSLVFLKQDAVLG